MVNVGQVQNGITRYLDNEIVKNMTGWQKWTFGAFGAIAVSRAGDIFETLKNNQMVAALGVIDNNDMIDIDTIYREFKRQAQAGAITIDVPVLGALSLNETDVDKMYNYITNA